MHDCAAPGCRQPVPDSRLACRTHWYALPKDVRDRIWATYVPGQTAATMSDDYAQALGHAREVWDG